MASVIPPMLPNADQIRWTGAVLGPRGIELLNRVEIVGSPEACAPYCLSAGSLKPRCVQVVFPRGQDRHPFLFVHEMAHAYHSSYLPHLTETTSVARAEACAILAEGLLGRRLPRDNVAEGRRRAWAETGQMDPGIGHALRIASRAAHEFEIVLTPLPMEHSEGDLCHDLFSTILFGCFDDEAMQGEGAAGVG